MTDPQGGPSVPDAVVRLGLALFAGIIGWRSWELAREGDYGIALTGMLVATVFALIVLLYRGR